MQNDKPEITFAVTTTRDTGHPAIISETTIEPGLQGSLLNAGFNTGHGNESIAAINLDLMEGYQVGEPDKETTIVHVDDSPTNQVVSMSAEELVRTKRPELEAKGFIFETDNDGDVVSVRTAEGEYTYLRNKPLQVDDTPPRKRSSSATNLLLAAASVASGIPMDPLSFIPKKYLRERKHYDPKHNPDTAVKQQAWNLAKEKERLAKKEYKKSVPRSERVLPKKEK